MPYLRRHGLLLLLIMIGFALRVYLLNDVTLSPDERNVTNEFLEIPLSDLLQTTTRHGFPEHLFAGILIWASYRLGWQLFILRWPGILFSVLTLAVIYKLTKKILGWPAALAATALLSLSYYHIFFSHQIRGYAEVVFFAVLSFFFLWQAMKEQQKKDWILFALTSALGIYNQFYSATLLATQGIIVAAWLALRAFQQRPKLTPFFRQQVMPPLMAGVGSLVIAALLFAAMLPQFFRNFAAADSDFTTSPTSLTNTLFPYYFLFYQYSGALSVWSVILYLSLILVGVVYLFRVKPEVAGVLLGWLIIPLLLVVLGQTFVSWFYVRERYLIYLLPAFIILVAAGWVGLGQGLKKINFTLGASYFWVSSIPLTVMSLVSIFIYLKTATVGNWQDTADFFAKNALPTDMIVCE
ncbi:MAG TPA: glycosyltransferase family 39 protein, partial [Anaerolineae bacterium]|nr:glycosyltransferase family 39 protein [Anaerolineae bacterium]